MVEEELITSSVCKILGWSILIQLFAKFIMGDILADTAILANTSKKEPLCSCYKHTSWMGWLLKKEGFVCQENMSTCNNSWRTVLSFRLLLSLLRCVFNNKLTPFISGNRFGCNVMDSYFWRCTVRRKPTARWPFFRWWAKAKTVSVAAWKDCQWATDAL